MTYEYFYLYHKYKYKQKRRYIMIKKHRLLIILLIIIPYINYAYIIRQETSYLYLNPNTHKVEVKYYDDKIMDDFKQSLIENRISREKSDTSIHTKNKKIRQKRNDLNFDMGFDTNGYPVVTLKPQYIRRKEQIASFDTLAKEPITTNVEKKDSNPWDTTKNYLIGFLVLIIVLYFISVFLKSAFGKKDNDMK